MNNEMIKSLIDNGWEWVAMDDSKTKKIFVYQTKPCVDLVSQGVFSSADGTSAQSLPSCLFHGITFENSPVELKTLLVDELEDREEQEFIKSLIDSGCKYLIKEWSDDVKAISNNETDFYTAYKVKHLCPNKYEKVYLKDLIKKRKVKKSVWVSIDYDGKVGITTEKPLRKEGYWAYEEGECTVCQDLKFLDLDWEGEPIELFYYGEE